LVTIVPRHTESVRINLQPRIDFDQTYPEM
jgi:hypothetical protein